jgi:hypothetical protein
MRGTPAPSRVALAESLSGASRLRALVVFDEVYGSSRRTRQAR